MWDEGGSILTFTPLLGVKIPNRGGGPRIRGTQVKSSVWMKKTQDSSNWLFLGNLIPEIESKAPN